MKRRITSPDGGQREELGERWDLIPGGYRTLRHVAKIAHHGARKYAPNNWQSWDFGSEQDPLNHGIAHAYEAMEHPPGSPERIRQLAKAVFNLLARMWYEVRLGNH